MKNQLNRDLIEKLKESNNAEFINNINAIIPPLISQVLEDVSAKSPLVRTDKCVLLPVNEIYTGSLSQLSQCIYFLGMENPQLESNSKRKQIFWKELWRDFRSYWRIGRRKLKVSKEPKLVTVEKYQISNFKHDVFKRLVDYLSASSIITEYQNYFTMVGNEDFGSNVLIKIYVCCYDSKSGIFKLPIKNKFFDVNFGSRFEILNKKFEELGQTFIDILTIFNAIFSKTYNRLPNQILLESLICGCPNQLFDKEDIYKTFINVANYITLIDPLAFSSVCDPKNNIFNEKLIIKTTSQVDFNKIVNMLENFKY